MFRDHTVLLFKHPYNLPKCLLDFLYTPYRKKKGFLYFKGDILFQLIKDLSFLGGLGTQMFLRQNISMFKIMYLLH